MINHVVQQDFGATYIDNIQLSSNFCWTGLANSAVRQLRSWHLKQMWMIREIKSQSTNIPAVEGNNE